MAATDRKAASIEMLACEAKGRALEVELKFQQAKRHADVAMDDAKSLAKKLKQVKEWLASMCKQMTEACQQEVQVTEEAQVEIANLKVSMSTSWTRRIPMAGSISYRINFSQQERRINSFGISFSKLVARYVIRDLRTKNKKGSVRWS